MRRQVTGTKMHEQIASSAYAINERAANQRRTIMVPKIVYEEVMVTENPALFVDTYGLQTSDQGSVTINYSRQMNQIVSDTTHDTQPVTDTGGSTIRGKSYSKYMRPAVALATQSYSAASAAFRTVYDKLVSSDTTIDSWPADYGCQDESAPNAVYAEYTEVSYNSVNPDTTGSTGHGMVNSCNSPCFDDSTSAIMPTPAKLFSDGMHALCVKVQWTFISSVYGRMQSSYMR